MGKKEGEPTPELLSLEAAFFASLEIHVLQALVSCCSKPRRTFNLPTEVKFCPASVEIMGFHHYSL